MASAIVASTKGSSIAMRMRGRDQRFLHRRHGDEPQSREMASESPLTTGALVKSRSG